MAARADDEILSGQPVESVAAAGTTLGRLTLGLALCFCLFVVGPALLPAHLRSSPSMTWGDVLDLAGPLVLAAWFITLYGRGAVRGSERVRWLFLGALVLFIDGHGMHLSANSIRHYISEGSREDRLAYFYDERLSHAIWRIGNTGLVGVLLWRHATVRALGRLTAATAVAALFYGLTTVLATIEAQTVAIDLPVALVVTACLVVAWRRAGRLPGDEVYAGLSLAYVLTLLFLAGWGLYWGGFPEFSSLGWI